MKMLFLAGIMILLAGCGQGGKGSANDGAQKPTPRPSPVESLKWGDLECQKTASCENVVLNFDLAQWVMFFNAEFAEPQNFEPGELDRARFQCGYSVANKWNHHFGSGLQFSPLEWRDIDLFIAEMVDTVSCTQKVDLDSNMESYFKLTKEYQNEVE